MLIQLHRYFEIARNQTCFETTLSNTGKKAPQRNTIEENKVNTTLCHREGEKKKGFSKGKQSHFVKMTSQGNDCETRSALLYTKGQEVAIYVKKQQHTLSIKTTR